MSDLDENPQKPISETVHLKAKRWNELACYIWIFVKSLNVSTTELFRMLNMFSGGFWKNFLESEDVYSNWTLENFDYMHCPSLWL